ncbi:hypothetical protein [Rodentibacter pneumotropicus]|uniref:Uncharacterized protein n=1 Tax=Rodentibacter pneumotropicus TaxID=758 RepID=A0A4S2PY15_9PAST|nr:hypothetical protein [Rodentibacter pneumotropicus]THA08978.1 hypothetical protein D3M78_06630 [Rodentibacter pneumotropicus]
MTKSSLTFFFKEYCEKRNLTHEEIQERFAILQYQAEVERDTTQNHEPLEKIFAKWRQACQNKHAQNYEPNQGVSQSPPTSKKERVLVVPVESSEELAVLELVQAFFQSDRSLCEILKLSNCLFNLGKAYNKSGK